MTIDWSVNLAEVATLLAGGIGIIISQIVSSNILGFRMKAVEDKVQTHANQLETLTKIVGDQRVMEERITNLRRDMDDLRRGKGYIRDSDD